MKRKKGRASRRGQWGKDKAEAEKIAPKLFKHMTASEEKQLSLHEFDGLVPEGGGSGSSGSGSGDLFSPANITRAAEIFKAMMAATAGAAKPEKTKEKEPEDKDWF